VRVGDTGEQVEEAIRSIRRRAVELDEKKQASAYSGPVGATFQAPSHTEYAEHASAALDMAEAVLDHLRSHRATTASLDEFPSVLAYSVRYARSLGYLDVSSREDFYASVAQGGGSMLQLSECLPDDEAFMSRVAERYAILPARLPVTLPQLRASTEFRAFRKMLRERLSYPDWVLLGVIFNLVLNARVDVDAYSTPQGFLELRNWSERVDVDQPLDVALFTNLDAFERMLDVWLLSFLTGLGLVPELPDGQPSRIRRVAARWFGVFDRDVPHEDLFPD
jgi:hypothetical protein